MLVEEEELHSCVGVASTDDSKHRAVRQVDANRLLATERRRATYCCRALVFRWAWLHFALLELRNAV